MGQEPSCLFSAPHFTLNHIKVDLLHTADLGVTQEAIGHVLYEILQEMGEGTMRQRCTILSSRLRSHYQEFRPCAQLQELTVDMLRKTGKPPKFRGKAALTRHLLPWVCMLAREFCSGHRRTPHTTARYAMIYALCEFYQSMDTADFDAEACKRHGLRCLNLWGALVQEARAADRPFYVWKPKFHLFGELILWQIDELGPQMMRDPGSETMFVCKRVCLPSEERCALSKSMLPCESSRPRSFPRPPALFPSTPKRFVGRTAADKSKC